MTLGLLRLGLVETTACMASTSEKWSLCPSGESCTMSLYNLGLLGGHCAHLEPFREISMEGSYTGREAGRDLGEFPCQTFQVGLSLACAKVRFFLDHS